MRTLPRILPKLISAHGLAGSAVLLVLGMLLSIGTAAAEPGWVTLPGHVPKALARLTPVEGLPQTNRLVLALGLPLRNRPELDRLLIQQQDPRSIDYHRYLTPRQFTDRFGPTVQAYRAVMEFARSNMLAVVGTHRDRLVLEVEGSVVDIERAFHVTLNLYKYPTERREFYAPAAKPQVPADVPVIEVEGLSDFWRPHPLLHPASGSPTPLSGSGPSGYYAGNDFRRAYAPGTALTGAGQSVALVEFSDYYPSDITSYESTIGLATPVPLVNVVVGHGKPPDTANNAEVALDIEMAIAMAPGLSQVFVYEVRGLANAATVLSTIASDNKAKQISCSWSWGGGPSATVDGILQQMAVQGQSFFQASGDSDAYTGANTLDSTAGDAPVDSPYVICVGGTALTMDGAGTAWRSETAWNRNSLGGADANVGSGGGISAYYSIPSWQKNIDMSANSGSTTWRNIPDVALTADQVYVTYNNGSSGGFAGTSCAAPLWAGFCALANQLSVSAGGSTVGFLNPALYAIARSSSYGACFHDITTGNNIGTNTPGLFPAVAGYDLCTGLGTPNGTNLINALVPAPHFPPSFTSQPDSQTAAAGSDVAFSATASGTAPLAYQWRKDGANLLNGVNVSGATSDTLTLSGVTLADAGTYTLIVSNPFGSATSSPATLTVTQPSSSIALRSSSNPSGFNEKLSFSASVTPPTATGSVQFLTNGVPFDLEPLATGNASSLVTSALPRGTNLISAIYSGDSAYPPATNTLWQVVTNHPPMVMPFATNRYAGFPLLIPVASLAANWSDVDGDTLSLAGIGLSTNGVAITNTGDALLYSNSNNVDDVFVCAVTDGWGGTNYQTVTVSVVPLPADATPRILSVSATVNGVILLQLAGESGLAYVLQTTTNLSTSSAWLPLATNTLSGNGLWGFSDTVTNSPRRFYRLSLDP